jgi:hypothetical protein
MTIKELHEIYGQSKKAKQTINTAISREIPGVTKILELTHKISCQLPQLPPKQRAFVCEILEDLQAATDEITNHISQKHDFVTATMPENEKKKPNRPPLTMTAKEIEQLTEPNHRKAVSKLIREMVAQSVKKKKIS